MKTFPKSISDEIRQAYDFYHGDENSELALYGGTFTAIKGWKEILQEAYECEKKLGMNGIRISTRPDEIKDMEFLKECDVKTVELGAQSMHQDVLNAAKRDHKVEDVRLAVNKLKSVGIKVSIHLMTGLPQDTKEKSIFSAFKIGELNVDGVRIHPTLILKDTELAELYVRGLYKPQSLDEALDWTSDMIGIFWDGKIIIERIGMYQDTQTLPNVIAGPYHPSFGELARSRLYRKFLISTSANEVYGPARLRSQIVGRNKDLGLNFTNDSRIAIKGEKGKMFFDDWLHEYVLSLREMAKCDS